MNIGFDAKRAFHNTSGLGNYSRDLIRILSGAFTSDELFLFDPKQDQKPFDYNQSNTQIVKPMRGFYTKASAIWRQFRVAGLAKKLNIEVYHGLSNELPYGIQKVGIKSIVTIHDLIFERYPEWYALIDRNIYRQKFKRAAQTADVVVAISEQTKCDLIEFYGIEEAKIKVIYQGCHEAFHKTYQATTKAKVQAEFNLPPQFVLSVGTIEARKNLKTVLQALKDLPQIHLVVVGRKTAYANEAFTWAKNNGMEDRIHHLQNVSMHQLAVIYQLASIFVYPSIFEGFGIPIIEALFSKTPVITSKGSCFSEAGGPASVYLNPTKVEEWKAALETLWNSKARRKNMAEEGFIFAEQFKDKPILNEWKILYNNFRK